MHRPSQDNRIAGSEDAGRLAGLWGSLTAVTDFRRLASSMPSRLYVRFTLSYRDIEDLLAERGLDISYETVRSWVLKFGLDRASAAAVPSPPERSMAAR